MRRMAWAGIFLTTFAMLGCSSDDSAPATSTTNTSSSNNSGGPVVQAPPGGGGAPAAPAAQAPAPPALGGGGPPPPGAGGGNPLAPPPATAGGPGFGGPPPGIGGPPGGFGGPPGSFGGGPGLNAPGSSAGAGGASPNYLGIASALGSAATTAPLTNYEKAMIFLQQSKNEEAFGYLYADAVTGSVKAKALQMKWSAALKRPITAVRFGVAVTYNKPEKYTGSPMAIGTKFNEQGQPQGVGGGPGGMAMTPGGPGAGNQEADSGPADPVANLEHFTGEFGKKMMSTLNDKLKSGSFGAFYQDAVTYKAPPAPVPVNLASFMGGPAAGSTPPTGGFNSGAYGPPSGGYSAPGSGSPGPDGKFPSGGPISPNSAQPPAAGPGGGGGGFGSNSKMRPSTIELGPSQILAQQQDGNAGPSAPALGAGGPPGPGGGPGFGGPGGMFGGQAAAPKAVAGVKYYKYTAGESQKLILDRAKSDGIDVLIHFSVKVEPPNRLGRNADNVTTCRLIHVQEGAPLYEGGRSLTASKVSEKPDLVDAAVKGIFAMMEEGVTTGKPVGKLTLDELPSAVNAETVKGRVQKISTPGGEGAELMQRLAELRFYNAKRILSLIDMKAAYEGILGADAGAKLALGSTNEKRLTVVKWIPNVEPNLAPPPAANNNAGGFGGPVGGFGSPPGGVGGPPGYGGPSGYGGGPPIGKGDGPPPGYGPPGGVGGSPNPGSPNPGSPNPGSPAPGGPGSGGFGAPPPGVGGPPGGGGPGLPGKGAGS